MSVSASSTSLPAPSRAPQLALYGLGLALAVLVGAVCAVALQAYPVSLGLLLAGCAGLLIALAVALARYDAAVAVAIALTAVVRFEPAPADALLAVVLAVALVTGRFDIGRVPLPVLGTVGLFLALNVVSAIAAIDPAIAALFLAITLYLCLFALWMTGYLNSTRRARLVVRSYVAAALASAIAGSIALFTGVGAELLTVYDVTRVSALFKDPNVFGPFLVPAALILLEESLRPRLLSRRRVLNRIGFVILVAGVLFSYSRAAWLNIVVGAVVMLVVLAFRRRSGSGAVGLLLIVTLAALAVAATVAFTESASFLEDRAQFQSYDTDRFDAQRRGIQFGEQRPVGIGPGQFEVEAPLAAHSTYVRVLAEQGALGLLLLGGLFLGTLVLAVRNAVRGRDTFGIGSAALLGAWCGILANSIVVDTLHWRHLWLVAAMIWAAAAAAGLRARGRGAR